METIIDLLRRKISQLTKKQRLVANVMLSEPEAMSFLTLRELAKLAGVSEMTVLHSCEALGFKNYNEVKYEFRRYISLQAKVETQTQDAYRTSVLPSYEDSEPLKLLADMCNEEADVSRKLFSQLDFSGMLTGAQKILDAENTIFVGRGVSLQVAQFLSMRLAIMGLPSVVMNTENIDSLHSALPLIGKKVAFVAISLPDYYMMTTKVCQYAGTRNAPVLGFTDTHKSPIVPFCQQVFYAPSSTRLFLNTIGPMMSLANMFSIALNVLKSRQRHGKSDAISDFAALFNS